MKKKDLKKDLKFHKNKVKSIKNELKKINSREKRIGFKWYDDDSDEFPNIPGSKPS